MSASSCEDSIIANDMSTEVNLLLTFREGIQYLFTALRPSIWRTTRHLSFTKDIHGHVRDFPEARCSVIFTPVATLHPFDNYVLWHLRFNTRNLFSHHYDLYWSFQTILTLRLFVPRAKVIYFCPCPTNAWCYREFQSRQ